MTPWLILMRILHPFMVVLAVAGQIEQSDQGEVLLLARRPQRRGDLVAGDDRVGVLVFEDAGHRPMLAADFGHLDAAFFAALAGSVVSAE